MIECKIENIKIDCFKIFAIYNSFISSRIDLFLQVINGSLSDDSEDATFVISE